MVREASSFVVRNVSMLSRVARRWMEMVYTPVVGDDISELNASSVAKLLESLQK